MGCLLGGLSNVPSPESSKRPLSLSSIENAFSISAFLSHTSLKKLFLSLTFSDLLQMSRNEHLTDLHGCYPEIYVGLGWVALHLA